MPVRVDYQRRTPPVTLLTVLVPLAAIIVSNLDVALLTLVSSDSALGRLHLGVWAPIPLSMLVGAWTFSVFRKMQVQMARLTDAEASLQQVVHQRERALADLEAALTREVSLRKELDHRVRNNLAGLVGLVGLYEESGRSASQLAEAIRGKIAALREVYRIINSTGAERLDLHDLLASIATEPVSEGARPRVHLSGPVVTLSSGEASALAMIAQELLVNSFKHGALALGAPDDSGVHITWTTRPGHACTELELQWNETGVSPVSPVRSAMGGVGLPLIAGFAETDLRGSVKFEHTGTQWRVDLRARLGAEPASARPHSHTSPQEMHA